MKSVQFLLSQALMTQRSYPFIANLFRFRYALPCFTISAFAWVVTVLCCFIPALMIPMQISYPFIANLTGLSQSILLNCASILLNVLSVSAITGLLILQNKAVDQNQRGAANGIAMTAMSLFKTIGPAGAGILFSWSERRLDAAFLPVICTMGQTVQGNMKV
ncbi:protein ZINC INDUCED FACILITATOR 1 [Capsella rubella]|uniref:protein ZINC INDUCED FACILITATOR 1 n=1 Tax=Capsella rubella TaxID=81985 RepID=UPI000CD54546|nr:protein ZINC INDUCED FACILITATOR 1 [Capsella rubella]